MTHGDTERLLIEFRNVTKKFAERTVLDNVDLEIHDGHVTTIIGKSGTGKSVLLKHIIGLLHPTAGTVLYNGVSVHEMNRKDFHQFQSQFSYCFQNNALFDSLTVAGNIALPLEQTTRMGKRAIAGKVYEKMEQLEVADVADKYPGELSGGMQKRVALARALVTDPKIVLFDEPTTGQDPIRKNAILSMIVQNQKKFGFSTIMISHDIPDVFFISDRILVLYEGKIIFQGTYSELDRLDHPIVEEYVQSLKVFRDELSTREEDRGLSAMDETGKVEKTAGAFTVCVFVLNGLPELTNRLGQKRADEIVQALGDWINRYFGETGISNRVTKNQFASILSNIDAQQAEKMMNRFTRELQNHGLGGTCALEGATTDGTEISTFTVGAGFVAGTPGEDLMVAINKAKQTEREIAVFACPKG
jgi:phospholipid/cholesterol/gamma-HCH transport system ATP-binding protein